MHGEEVVEAGVLRTRAPQTMGEEEEEGEKEGWEPEEQGNHYSRAWFLVN